MISITKRSGNESQYVNEYIADTEEDILKLPKDCSPGSTALCVATSSVYIMNSNKEWKEL